MALFLQLEAPAVELVSGFPAHGALAAVVLAQRFFAKTVEIGERPFQRALGGSAVAFGEREPVMRFRRPLGRIGHGFVDCTFDRIIGTLLAPEKPAGERGVLYQRASARGGGRKFCEQIIEQGVEVFTALTGDDQFFGSAAVRCGVAAGDFFAGDGDGSGLVVEFLHKGLWVCQGRCAAGKELKRLRAPWYFLLSSVDYGVFGRVAIFCVCG
ncbi:MAG TPA: hypothetical protein VGL97_21930 [Bryobacteraceae bacterium]